jgi:hypothetical protein
MKNETFDSSCSDVQFINIISDTVYDNKYTLFIDIYFYEYFHLALVLQTFLDTLSNILDKCLRFSLIKIESVSIFHAKPLLYILFY